VAVQVQDSAIWKSNQLGHFQGVLSVYSFIACIHGSVCRMLMFQILFLGVALDKPWMKLPTSITWLRSPKMCMTQTCTFTNFLPLLPHNNAQSKMEEMLMTWHTGGTNGNEHFGSLY
jgi:hypothetical protein